MTEATPVQDKIVKTFNDTNYFAKGTYKREYIELLTTATLANFFTKTLLAPLERWRIIKQTQTTYELRPSKIKSFKHYFHKVRKEQGWGAFWRGNTANLWLHGWQILTQVTLFDTIKASFREFAYEMQNKPISSFLLERVAAPLMASACTLIFTHPIDTARVRISMNYYRNPREILFNGVTSCWSLIRLEEKSMRGIYRGYLMANLIAVLHLNIYASLRDLYCQFKVQGNQLVDLLASKEAVGSLVALMLLHPLDTLKKNLQLNNQSKPRLFNNSIQVLSYLRQGPGGIKAYQGLTVTIVRHLLYCPIFALSLSFLNQNVNIL